MFFRSARGTSSVPSSSSSTPMRLSTGTDSPVSAASSTFMDAHSTMRQSAGTASPASRITMSPTTSSDEGTETSWPSRTALLSEADISWRAARASSALDSWTTPRTAFTTTTKEMMITSAKSAWPCAMPVSAEITAATISMMIIGSASWARKRFQSGVFSASLSLFGPFFSSLAAASACERPVVTSVWSVPRTSASPCRYSFMHSLLVCGHEGPVRAGRLMPDHNSPGGARAHQGCHTGFLRLIMLPDGRHRSTPNWLIPESLPRTSRRRP